ncbi:hypothetical protein NEOLI_003392 [Neolecta irregularis DAH-3]|uniref:Uncharacterized protein n=1 Tax=Neolecta irregularis (strain DAH-3) TaxID=1198029 RepID=A0A1U7LQ82_NEOID|nr:hypothetical protein NEOLI_003392 [Neolecta irregularis DAH-3]|eukprot:OLL24743.1 hypothetical protein NEOLI_003392 [Neolecta irregularis DAH-3]
MHSQSQIQLNNATPELIPDFSGLSAALLRSRQTYLSAGLFKSFWSRSATRKSKKNPEGKSNQPEHNLTRLGVCDVSFGVHTFPETKFFVAKYLGPLKASSGVESPTGSAAESGSCQAMMTKNIPLFQESSVTGASVVTGASSRPTFTSISPLQQQAVIDKLNQAARSNPQLMQILSMVANGTASPQQVEVLTNYIQATSVGHDSNPTLHSPARPEAKAKAKAPKAKSPPQARIVMGTDIVFEFRENVSERWMLPKSAILDTSNPQEALLSFLIVTPPLEGITVHYQPTTMTLHNCPGKICEAIRQVIDPLEKVAQEMAETMNKIARSKVTSEFAAISATVKSEDRYAPFTPFSKAGTKRGPYKKKAVCIFGGAADAEASESTSPVQDSAVLEATRAAPLDEQVPAKEAPAKEAADVLTFKTSIGIPASIKMPDSGAVSEPTVE